VPLRGDVRSMMLFGPIMIAATMCLQEVPFVEPVLCIKAIGGPFEFTIDIVLLQDGE
jgi:hypothetical protein